MVNPPNAFYNSLTIKTEALCDLIRMIATTEQLLPAKHFYKYMERLKWPLRTRTFSYQDLKPMH